MSDADRPGYDLLHTLGGEGGDWGSSGKAGM